MPQEMPTLQPRYMPIREAGDAWKATRRWMTSKRLWELSKDWHYTLPDGARIVIPKGFGFDGASAPRIFWPWMPPAGPLLIPSLIHDFAYAYDYLWVPDGNGGYRKQWQGAGRQHWDQLFHQLCLDEVGRMLFSIPSGSVMKLLGRKAWRRHRAQQRPELTPGKESP